MANTYTWDCKTVDIYPTYESLNNVVYRVHWRITATSDQNDPDGNPYNASVYGNQEVSLVDVSTGFVHYADLTNEIITGWTETAMGTAGVQFNKDVVNESIAEQITPTIETKIG